MCGLAGLFTKRPTPAGSVGEAASRMTACITHRGPDDGGTFADESAGVALSFRRLAIIDLSPAGHQPMVSASGRFTIVFNGEVFNHNELRAELRAAGASFRGHSDTEVILAAFERWGIDAAVRRFVGMFAIAVWDAERRALTLLRDRLGIKPLYVYQKDGLVSFGSELKTLVSGPSFDRALDTDSVASFLRYLYVPGPRTIYRHARKLPQGHHLTITDPEAPLPASVPYWSVEEAARAGLADPRAGADEDIVSHLDRTLAEVVKLRMEADVPLGAFLSGGIDSTTVVALMQAASSTPVKTYSIAFDRSEHNEAHHAAAIAKHLGTEHTETLLTGEDALNVVPKLADMFDEPFADTSQIPSYLVCQVARRHVTVALSGDGGDEVFGGYNRYTQGEPMLARVARMPRSARRLVAAGIGSVPAESWDRAHRAVAPVLPRSLRHRLPGQKLAKVGRLLGAAGEMEMYRSLVSVWQRPEELVPGVREPEAALERILRGGAPERLLDRMMLADQLTYLAEDGLTKVDRVSMAVSLEVRVPLLDHRLVELSWRVPSRLKVRDGVGKWALREVLARYVPRDLFERPKMGFSVPLDAWLAGPLRPWAEDLLSADAIRRAGVLRPEPVQRAWRDFRGGHTDLALPLWSVLMFQAWHARWAA